MESNKKIVQKIGSILFWFGLGVFVHDYAHTLWQIGGYGEILAPQGGWIGLAILLLGYFLPYMRKVKRAYRRYKSDKRRFEKALKFKAFRVLQRVLHFRRIRKNPEKMREE